MREKTLKTNARTLVSSWPKSAKKIRAERRNLTKPLAYSEPGQDWQCQERSPKVHSLLHDPKSHERKPKARFKEVGAEKLRREYVPVLVEATLALHVDVLGPDGLQGTEATGSFNVANHTNTDHWGSFDDGHSLNDLAGTSL